MPNSEVNDFTFVYCLKTTFQENVFFFFSFLLVLIIGSVALLSIQQGDLLLHFSANRNEFGDLFFKNATKLGEEWAYIFFLILFLFIRFRYALLIPIIGGLVTIISYMSKSFFQHPRPSDFYKALGTFQDINLVEGVYVVKGLTSFPSGHTMSAFALFSLVAFLIKDKKGMAILLLLCAVSAGLSRVYLVQHFLKDIYLGAIMGVGIALLVYAFQGLFPINEERKIDGKLRF